MMTENPLFSIIILLWNSNQFLNKCLTALDKQTDKDFEIILIDNGSSEPLNDQIFCGFPELLIRFYRIEENIGFAAGNNFGSSKANGEYLVLLNSDAFPETNWLEIIKNKIGEYPDCSFASLLLMANNHKKLDGAGDLYHVSGLVSRRYYNYLVDEVTLTEKEVFSACGAAAIYPKKLFEMVGGFDPDFFAYVEDIDMGFRLQLLGYRCIFVPQAIVYHVGSGSTEKRSEFSIYHGQRNLIWAFVKNMPGVLFWFLLSFQIITNFLLIIVSIFRKRGQTTIQAKKDALKDLTSVFQKRKEIQKNRKESVLNIIRILDWNPLFPIVKMIRM